MLRNKESKLDIPAPYELNNTPIVQTDAGNPQSVSSNSIQLYP